MAEKSERTKMIEDAPVEDGGRFGIPGMLKKALTAGSKAEDYFREASGIKRIFKIPDELKGQEAEGKTASGLPREARGVKMAKGGKVSSASKRADGCAVKGKTRGRMV